MAFTYFKSNFQQYSLFNKLSVCIQNLKYINESKFFCIFLDSCTRVSKEIHSFAHIWTVLQNEATLAAKSGWMLGQALMDLELTSGRNFLLKSQHGEEGRYHLWHYNAGNAKDWSIAWRLEGIKVWILYIEKYTRVSSRGGGGGFNRGVYIKK